MLKILLLLIGIIVLAYFGIKYFINKGIEKVQRQDNRAYYRSNRNENQEDLFEGFGDDGDD